MNSEKKAALQVLTAGCLWGCIGIFLKMLAAAGIDSLQAVALRVVVTALFYVVFLLIKNPSALKIRLKDLCIFICSGICSVVFFSWCYFNAITESSMGVAAVLLYTAPIFVMLMSAVLFREKMTGKKVLALFLAFLGCGLVSGMAGGGGLTLRALLFGLGAGFGYALYSIFGVIGLRKYDSLTVTAWSFIMAGLASLPLAKPAVILGGLTSVTGILGALGICLFNCILPYLLYTRGLQGMEAGKASTLATVEPVVAAVLGIVLYKEDVTIQKIAGIVLVLAAVLYLQAGSRKKPEREMT